MPEEQKVIQTTFGALARMHQEYNEDLWKRLELLFEGGYKILKHSSEFIHMMPDETTGFYKHRCKSAAYVNYLAPLIGYLVGNLFGQAIEVLAVGKDGKAAPTPDDDFYTEFSDDCDLKGTKFTQLEHQATVKALLMRRSVVGIDLPMAPEVLTRADEEREGGGRAFLSLVPVDRIINWELDDHGNYLWLVLHDVIKPPMSPFEVKDTYRHRFTVWELLEDETGPRAFFSIFETADLQEDQKPSDEDPLTAIVSRQPTSFTELPFKVLDVGCELWAGDKVGPLCEEHYRDRTNLKADMARSLNEIPFVKRGPETPAVHGAFPSETQQDPNRGSDPAKQYKRHGWLAIGSEDELGFAGPTGRAHELTAKMLVELREEIHRSVTAMSLSLSNTASAVGRSGESKREDRSATGKVLHALAEKVRDHARDIYTCVSRARGEDTKWSAQGLDSYDDDDRGDLVEEAPIVDSLSIPSETFQQVYFTGLALKLVPQASSDEKERIRTEIAKGVKEKQEANEQMRQLLSKQQVPPGDDEEEGDEGGGDDNEDGKPPVQGAA